MVGGNYPNSRLACLFCTQNCHRTHGVGQETGPRMLSFVKVVTKCMICRDYRPSVAIPNRFRDCVSYHHNMEVILEGPSGEEWAVRLYENRDCHSMAFRAGWGRFAVDNRLELGDVVFFACIGGARFSLKIYGGDGTEKRFPFSAKNAQARKANKKRLEREWEAEDSASNATQAQVVGRINETAAAAETSTSVHDGEFRRLTRQAAKSSPPPSKSMDAAPAGKPNVDPCSSKTVQLGSPENPIDLGDNTSESSVRASSVRRKLQFGQKHGWNGNEASGVPFLRRNIQRQAPLVRSKCLMEELAIQAAHRLAMEAASSYVTNCPSFIISLRSFQVTGGDVLDVKRDFAKQFLPRKPTNIVLVDMNGRSWPVKWFGIRRSVIAAGWADFVQHHSLKSRDVCLFELTAPRKFQVRIYRLMDFPQTLDEAEAKGTQDTKDEVEIIIVEDEEGITLDDHGNVQDKQNSAVEDKELLNKLMQLMHKPATDLLSVFYKLAKC